MFSGSKSVTARTSMSFFQLTDHLVLHIFISCGDDGDPRIIRIIQRTCGDIIDIIAALLRKDQRCGLKRRSGCLRSWRSQTFFQLCFPWSPYPSTIMSLIDRPGGSSAGLSHPYQCDSRSEPVPGFVSYIKGFL